MRQRLLALAVAATLAACASHAPQPTPRTTTGSATPPPAPQPAPGSAEQRTALAAELTVEQQWLESFFKGTPVQIRQRDDGALWVDVPREFCFDTGRSNVKPALAAVLDKLAESLRRRPAAIVTLVSAPDDHPGSSPLALQRAAQVHKHLRDRGVPMARLGEPRAATGGGVQLRIIAPPG